jgi:hypothetical protein
MAIDSFCPNESPRLPVPLVLVTAAVPVSPPATTWAVRPSMVKNAGHKYASQAGSALAPSSAVQ